MSQFSVKLQIKRLSKHTLVIKDCTYLDIVAFSTFCDETLYIKLNLRC